MYVFVVYGYDAGRLGIGDFVAESLGYRAQRHHDLAVFAAESGFRKQREVEYCVFKSYLDRKRGRGIRYNKLRKKENT